jgi:hypothetical protein
MRGAGEREKGAGPSAGLRTRLVMLGMALLFMSVAGQLARLAATTGPEMVVTLNEPMARTYVRPDILDRGGTAARNRHRDAFPCTPTPRSCRASTTSLNVSAR